MSSTGRNKILQKSDYPNFYRQEIGGPWNHTTNKKKASFFSQELLIEGQSEATNGLSNDFRKFCNETTLHGLNYIGQSELHIFERIFWTIAFFLGIVAAGGLIWIIFTQFRSNPITVIFGSSQADIDQIPFPAVTICSVNKAEQNVVDQISKILREDANGTNSRRLSPDTLYYLQQICLTTSPSFSSKMDFFSSVFPEDLMESVTRNAMKKNHTQSEVDTILREAVPTCEEMIVLCRWEDEPADCDKLFHSTITDFGICCSFNMAPLDLLQKNEIVINPNRTANWTKSDLSIEGLLLDPEVKTETKPPEYPRRSKRPGLSYGLSILLDPNITEYFCTSSDSSGFQLVTHLPIESAHPSNYGLAIGPDVEVFIKVTPDITVAERDIGFIGPEERKCYLIGERSLKYYTNYTQGNCIEECLANVTYENCGCIIYYMTRDVNRRLCGSGPEDNTCAQKAKKDFFSAGREGRCLECLPTCTRISYLSQMTVRPMRNDKDIWRKPGVKATWANRNSTLVHVYFGDDKVYPKIRQRLISITDLIADIGGILGLCLGFSVLSGIEIVYFLFFKIIGKQLTTK